MSLRDQPLEIAVIGDRLVISIGIDALAELIPSADFWDSEEMTVTDPDAAAHSIVLGLENEQEDGTNAIHLAFDAAIEWAVDQGEAGFGDGQGGAE